MTDFAVRFIAEAYGMDLETARAILDRPLPTPEECEDAAASALAALIEAGLADGASLLSVCKLLLRGSVDEVGIWPNSRRCGAYCLRAPSDPVLRDLGHLGAALVELSYTVRDPARARTEARALMVRFLSERGAT
jgi:hypothetical protein